MLLMLGASGWQSHCACAMPKPATSGQSLSLSKTCQRTDNHTALTTQCRHDESTYSYFGAYVFAPLEAVLRQSGGHTEVACWHRRCVVRCCSPGDSCVSAMRRPHPGRYHSARALADRWRRLSAVLALWTNDFDQPTLAIRLCRTNALCSGEDYSRLVFRRCKITYIYLYNVYVSNEH